MLGPWACFLSRRSDSLSSAYIPLFYDNSRPKVRSQGRSIEAFASHQLMLTYVSSQPHRRAKGPVSRCDQDHTTFFSPERHPSSCMERMGQATGQLQKLARRCIIIGSLVYICLRICFM